MKCHYDWCNLEAERGSHGLPERQFQELVPLDSFCILHDPNPDKDTAHFTQTLDEKIRSSDFNLRRVVFSGAVDFGTKAFDRSADFGGAVFLKEAHFSEATFQADADFLNAGFQVNANFNGTNFQRDAIFESVDFLGEANFYGATFKGEANFGFANFQSEANFIHATFQRMARFWAATFGSFVTFSGAEFQGEASFWMANFQEGARYDGAILRERLDFREAELPGVWGGYMFFQELRLLGPEAILFENVNLSMTSFLNTDMTRVRVVGVEWELPMLSCPWPRPAWWRRALGAVGCWLRVIISPSQRLVLFDQRRLKGAEDIPGSQHPKDFVDDLYLERTAASYRLVELLYRQLRINLEREKQEVEAGHFYMGEMEMRRRNPGPLLWGPTPFQWVNKVLLNSYWVAASYGESFFRPLAIYLLLGALFALVYLGRGFNIPNVRDFYWLAPSEQGWGYDFLLALRHSLNPLAAFAADFRPLDWVGGLLRIFNSFLNVILLAAIGVALRRRFKR